MEASVWLAISYSCGCIEAQHSRLSQNNQTPYGFWMHQEKVGLSKIEYNNDLEEV